MSRLLYVDAKWPRPRSDAASQRATQLVGELVRLGFDVDFGALSPGEHGGELDDPIDLAGARPVVAVDEAALLDHVHHRGHEYDVAVVAWTRVAERLLGPLRAASPHTLVCFDTNDVNHVREYRHARVSGNANILRRALAMKRAELGAVAAADVTIAISEHDAGILRAGVPAARVEVITLAVATRPDEPPGPAGRRGAIYLGNYNAWHNVDAVSHLVADVVPELERRGSGLSITLAGAGRHALIDALASARVTVAGFVDDVAAAFDRQRMFVAPLRVGSGVKGKLLTALALGLPVVATPIAIEGIPLVDGQTCLLASTPADFAAACLRLERDDELWRRLSAAGRAMVTERFSQAVVREQVGRVFGPLRELSAVAGGRARR
ncbi:MAG TPA: glycosyltransferase family 4 protein [Candidatus Limnocylindrales bacterium]